MINNAGIMPHSPLERLKVDDWDRMIDVNIKGVLYGIAAALPYMQQQKSGHIINVSSVAGCKMRPGAVVYAATKTAVRVISEGLRMEVKPYNIRTTVISPGAVATELPESVTEPDVAESMRRFCAELATPAEFIRPHGGLCHQPAGRCGCERDTVPTYAPGTVGAFPDGFKVLMVSKKQGDIGFLRTGWRDCLLNWRTDSPREQWCQLP